jgi:putative transposase
VAQVQNKDVESILGEIGLAGQLKKMPAERMLTAELNHHLANEAESSENHRNGSSSKTVLTPGGKIQRAISPTRYCKSTIGRRRL